MYSAGVRSRQATGWMGMRTRFPPISLTLTKCSLLQCPCISSLSGSEMASPRKMTVFPSGSTNLFPLTEISGNFLASVVKGRWPGAGSRHQACIRLAAAAAAGCTAGAGWASPTFARPSSTNTIAPSVVIFIFVMPIIFFKAQRSTNSASRHLSRKSACRPRAGGPRSPCRPLCTTPVACIASCSAHRRSTRP